MKFFKLLSVLALCASSTVSFASQDTVDVSISSYISNLNTSSQKKNILMEQFNVLRDIVNMDLQNVEEEEIKITGIRYMKVMSCLSGLYAANGEDPEFMRQSREITKKTLDTQEKDRHFHKFLAKIEKMNMNNWASQGTASCGKK